MITTIETQARAAADRVDKTLVSFDPFSIFMLILPALLKCLQGDDTEPEPTPEQMHAQFHERYDRRPLQTTNQVKHAIARKGRQEQHRRIRGEELEELTDAFIAQSLAADVSTLGACCAEIGADFHA